MPQSFAQRLESFACARPVPAGGRRALNVVHGVRVPDSEHFSFFVVGHAHCVPRPHGREALRPSRAIARSRRPNGLCGLAVEPAYGPGLIITTAW